MSKSGRMIKSSPIFFPEIGVFSGNLIDLILFLRLAPHTAGTVNRELSKTRGNPGKTAQSPVIASH
jgi:hypothetical protein